MNISKEPLVNAMRAYVPELLGCDVLFALQVEQATRESATLLFADVSGFTAMSENLGSLGKEGAEELTRVLNTYFTTMIDVIHSFGGAVIKFGGDAMTCHFPGGAVGLRQAGACALAMQAQMSQFQAVATKAGEFNLRMKIGISGGTVLAVIVGDAHQGLEYVLAGRPLDRMSAGEHHAVAGEVVVDGDVLALWGETWETLGMQVGEERDGFYLLTAMVDAPQPSICNDHTIPQSAEQLETYIGYLIPFLPPTVYERLLEGQRQFVGEHRRVVSMFIQFIGLDYDNDPDVVARLRRYFTMQQNTIVRYGGRLNRVITGDKGSLLHVIFGAPVTHENNEERAVRCALDMQNAALHSSDLDFITDQRIGIAAGYVFAGDVGAENRREYTVMGDVVNLSARLMQAAGPGELLMDQVTMRRVEDIFIYQTLPPVRVKGKREPVAVYMPVEVRRERRKWRVGEVVGRHRSTPIVGREAELAQITAWMDAVLEGRGQLLVISGEAGIGKTRLLQEVISLGRQRDMYGLGGICLSHATQTPYLPWVDLLDDFFGLDIDSETDDAEKINRVAQGMIAANPSFAEWIPLIGQLLGLPIPDNALTASLEVHLRKQRTFEIVLALLRHQARQTPLFMIVFEDTQWMDAISLELLNYVARNIGEYRIFLVVLTRPPVEFGEWQRYPYYHDLPLTDLPAACAVELIRQKLGMQEVPPALLRQVVRDEERVNPFFVEEVLNALVDQGYLLMIPGEKGDEYLLVKDIADAQIPDSIQPLVMSRIDRLDESSKLTIKVASIIGRTFRYRVVESIYPVDTTHERLLGNLEKLARIDLTVLEKLAPEWEYLFKHITTQEVAYESLLYAHRRELHERVARYFETAYEQHLEEYYELLAYHYMRSNNREKSWDYLVKAGKKAQNRYANESAIAYYQQAFPFAPNAKAAGEVHEALGDVYCLIGQYNKSEENYRIALEAWRDVALRAAEIGRKIAKTWEQQGRYDEAMQYLYLTLSGFNEINQTAIAARIFNDMGWIAMQQGDYKKALDFCQQGIHISEVLFDDIVGQQVKLELQHTLSSIYVRMGDYERAIANFKASIQMGERNGDLVDVARAYNNLAVVYWMRGEYVLASQNIQRSLELQKQIGNTNRIAMCYANLGGLAYTLGDYDHAIENYQQSLTIRQEIGDIQGIADLHNNLGEVYHSLGNEAEARTYLLEAVTLFTETGDKATLVDAYRLLAEVELASHNLGQAHEYGERSLQLVQEAGNQEYEGIVYRVLGQIDVAAQRYVEAHQSLLTSIERLRTTGNKFEMARSQYELGVLLSLSDPESAHTALTTAIALFEELGVEKELAKARAALAG